MKIYFYGKKIFKYSMAGSCEQRKLFGLENTGKKLVNSLLMTFAYPSRYY